jgi:hypothetical protein
MSVGYPDTMNKKGPSPLKARYTSSGESEDLQAVSIDVAAEKKSNKKTSGGASGTNKGSGAVKKIGAGIKKLFGG